MDLSFERKTEKINGKSHHVLETVSFYIALVTHNLTLLFKENSKLK